MRMIILLTFILSAFHTNAQLQIIDRIIAQVGSELVLLSEIEEQKALMEAQQGGLEEGTFCMIAENLMVQNLLVHKAKLDSVLVTEEEVNAQLDARIEQILAYMNNDVKQFESYYGQGIPDVKAKFKEDLEKQLLAQRMQSQLVNEIKVTPNEVKKFFATIPKDSLPYFNAEVEISEIVYKPKVNSTEKEKAIAKLEGLKARIVAGEDFAEIAKLFSQDPGSARIGGDLGVQKRGTFVPAFEAAAYNLERGELSEIVESEFGFHLIELLERRGNTIHTRHVLIKSAITEDDLSRSRNLLDSIRHLIEVDSITFSEGVKKYSNEKEQSFNNDGQLVNPKSGNTFFETGDLDPDIYFAIDTLVVDQISNPIEVIDPSGVKQYKLIKLVSRTAPHQANLRQDYSKIHLAAKEQKKSKALSEWIAKTVKSTFIKMDDNLTECANLQPWISKSNVVGP